MNASVYYNNGRNFVKEGFVPVVKVFKGLCGAFACSKCGGMLKTELKVLAIDISLTIVEKYPIR